MLITSYSGSRFEKIPRDVKRQSKTDEKGSRKIAKI